MRFDDLKGKTEFRVMFVLSLYRRHGKLYLALDINTLDFGVRGKHFYMKLFSDLYSELETRTAP
jgi:hypothetical protein